DWASFLHSSAYCRYVFASCMAKKNAQPVPRVPFYPRNRFAVAALATLAFFGEAVWMPAGGVERYKEYAAECLRIAQQTADDAQKARLLEMAEAWRRLSEAAAKQDKK